MLAICSTGLRQISAFSIRCFRFILQFLVKCGCELFLIVFLEECVCWNSVFQLVCQVSYRVQEQWLCNCV